MLLAELRRAEADVATAASPNGGVVGLSRSHPAAESCMATPQQMQCATPQNCPPRGDRAPGMVKASIDGPMSEVVASLSPAGSAAARALRHTLECTSEHHVGSIVTGSAGALSSTAQPRSIFRPLAARTCPGSPSESCQATIGCDSQPGRKSGIGIRSDCHALLQPNEATRTTDNPSTMMDRHLHWGAQHIVEAALRTSSPGGSTPATSQIEHQVEMERVVQQESRHVPDHDDEQYARDLTGTLNAHGDEPHQLATPATNQRPLQCATPCVPPPPTSTLEANKFVHQMVRSASPLSAAHSRGAAAADILGNDGCGDRFGWVSVSTQSASRSGIERARAKGLLSAGSPSCPKLSASSWAASSSYDAAVPVADVDSAASQPDKMHGGLEWLRGDNYALRLKLLRLKYGQGASASANEADRVKD